MIIEMEVDSGFQPRFGCWIAMLAGQHGADRGGGLRGPAQKRGMAVGRRPDHHDAGNLNQGLNYAKGYAKVTPRIFILIRIILTGSNHQRFTNIVGFTADSGFDAIGDFGVFLQEDL